MGALGGASCDGASVSSGACDFRLRSRNRRRDDLIGIRLGERRRNSSSERCEGDHDSRRQNGDNASLRAEFKRCTHLCIDSSYLTQRGSYPPPLPCAAISPNAGPGPAAAAALMVRERCRGAVQHSENSSLVRQNLLQPADGARILEGEAVRTPRGSGGPLCHSSRECRGGASCRRCTVAYAPVATAEPVWPVAGAEVGKCNH